ncbi:MAG TPA: ubiquitin-like domain-containing protein, partial [Mycobacterium sp.]|nr:ubiquitin-like domain-containing protein [Mycobacterium sp.]
MNVLTKLHQSPSPLLRIVVAALLVTLTFAGGYAVTAHKTVTLNVDGTPVTVTTMKSRVSDIVAENGFDLGERDEIYPAADAAVSDT